MLIAYLQFVTRKIFNKKHHLQDEKYKEKTKRPIKNYKTLIYRE